MVSSVSHFWRSPPAILDPVRALAAPACIGLDPCAGIASPVEADIEYSLELGLDGLLLPWTWQGLVYVNSPFGRLLRLWSRKMIGEADAGAEIVGLTPSRTGSGWCQQLIRQSDAHCFLKGRLTFLGARDPAPFDCMVTYFGSRSTPFQREFAPLGIVSLHARRRHIGLWHYEIKLEMNGPDGGRWHWQKSAPLSYSRARDELERWRGQGFEVRLREAS